MFQIVREAYETLFNDEKRKIYDSNTISDFDTGKDFSHKAPKKEYKEGYYNQRDAPSGNYTEEELNRSYEDLIKQEAQINNQKQKNKVFLKILIILSKIILFPVALLLQFLSWGLNVAASVVGGVLSLISGVIFIFLIIGTLLFEMDNISLNYFIRILPEILIATAFGSAGVMVLFFPSIIQSFANFLWSYLFGIKINYEIYDE